MTLSFGIVTNRDPLSHKVRVKFPDEDNMVSYWIPVIVPFSQDNKSYHIPDVGELVVCLFSDKGNEQGCCLGTVYNSKDIPAENDGDVFAIEFKDGAKIAYNRRTHQLDAIIPGEAIISATAVKLTGNLEVTGDITASGTIMDSSGNTNHHTH